MGTVRYLKPDPDYNDRAFTDANLREFELIAEGLSIDEACAYFSIGYDELTPEDRLNVDRAYKKAQTNFLRAAVSRLKTSGGNKEDLLAALMILGNFADNWKGKGLEEGLKTMADLKNALK